MVSTFSFVDSFMPVRHLHIVWKLSTGCARWLACVCAYLSRCPRASRDLLGPVATSGCASAAGMPAMHACMDATGPSGRTETGAFCSEEFSNDAIEYVGMIAGVEESFRFTAI